MYMPCEVVVSHYKPIHIEKGMIFGKLIMFDGELRWALWELKYNPQDDEEFINKHGFPVEISIVDFYGEKLASEHEIGWMDDKTDIQKFTNRWITHNKERISLVRFSSLINKFKGRNIYLPLYAINLLYLMFKFYQNLKFYFNTNSVYNISEVRTKQYNN